MKKNILKVATAIIVVTTTFWIFSNVNASELNLEVKKYKTVEEFERAEWWICEVATDGCYGLWKQKRRVFLQKV